tara:strand:+ start:395 stop:868 length:474 start_codon:yes stop_codon:yes gene_type:complete
MSNKMSTDIKKDFLINFYTNLLFEHKYGSWILNTNSYKNGYKLISKVNNIQLPKKIYTHFNNPPIHFKNIEHIKYYINNNQTSKFTTELEFYTKINIPKNYSIFIKFKNTDYYICYDYYFSKITYYDSLNSNNKENIEKTKDLEFKVYVLQQLKSKL